jgi:hypothetical protein
VLDEAAVSVLAISLPAEHSAHGACKCVRILDRESADILPEHQQLTIEGNFVQLVIRVEKLDATAFLVSISPRVSSLVLRLNSTHNGIFGVGQAIVGARRVFDGSASFEVVQEVGLGLSLLVDEAVDGIFKLDEALGDVGVGVLWDGCGEDAGGEAENES